MKILIALRNGKRTDSKARLARVLCILWLTWVLVNVPLAALEILMQTILKIEIEDDYDYKWSVDMVHWTPSVVERSLINSFVRVSAKLIVIFEEMEVFPYACTSIGHQN